jgi:MoaD family protein
MITVKLFGLLKTLTNQQSELSVALEGRQRVTDLIEALKQSYPQVAELILSKKVLISVNQEIAHPDTHIKDGDEVALLPPFAGGRL